MSSASILWGTMTLATAGMLLLSGDRWYGYATGRPDTLPARESPEIVLVHQSWDCPDAREAAERFQTLAQARGHPVSSVTIPEGGRSLEETLLRRRLHRAILRTGLSSTPAALVVDERGAVRFAHPFRAEEPDFELEAAVDAFTSILRVVSSGEGANGTRGEDAS